MVEASVAWQVVSALAAILAFYGAWLPMKLDINVNAFARGVLEYVKSGASDRAVALCAASDAPLAHAARQAIVHAQTEPPPMPDNVGYRDTANALELARHALLEQFDQGFDAATRGLSVHGLASILGAIMALVAAVGMAPWSTEPPEVAVLLWIATLVMVTGAGWARRRMRAGRKMWIESTLTPLAIAWVSGAIRGSAEQVSNPMKAPLGAAESLMFEVHEPGREPYTATVEIEEYLKIGRLKSCHLPLDHTSVSRIQAVIEKGEKGLSVIDLGGAVPTRVNGIAVNKAELRVGDEVMFGEVVVRLIKRES